MVGTTANIKLNLKPGMLVKIGPAKNVWMYIGEISNNIDIVFGETLSQFLFNDRIYNLPHYWFTFEVIEHPSPIIKSV